MKGFFAAFCLLVSLAVAGAPLWASESPTHKVRKGDTLWDLSEFYYGDHTLWPKLWEMNPFVTNPHLLKEGDILNLMELPPPVPSPRETDVFHEPAPPAVRTPDRGFDLSSLVDEAYAGFFSFEPVAASGSIVADETPRMILGGGDAVFVKLDSNVNAAPGDSFIVYRVAGVFEDPADRKRRGYAVSFKGRVVLSQKVPGGVFQGVIEDAVESISVGDPLMAAFPVERCISVSSSGKLVEGAVIASRHGRKLVGRFDVVYLNRGLHDGLERGSVLRIHRDASGLNPGFDKSLPLPPLGSLIVLAAFADSATALVLDADHEIPRGAEVSTVTGSHAETLVSSLPVCRTGEDTRKTLD